MPRADELDNAFDAVVQALVLAITAPTEGLSNRLVAIANALVDASPELFPARLTEAKDRAVLIANEREGSRI